MNRSIINILTLLPVFIFILFLTGCPETAEEESKDGKVTVNFINFDPANGLKAYIGLYTPDMDHTVTPPIELLSTIITDGTATARTKKAYKESKKFNIWFFIDINGNADPDDPLPDGPDFSHDTPFNVKINGDKTVTIDFTVI